MRKTSRGHSPERIRQTICSTIISDAMRRKHEEDKRKFREYVLAEQRKRAKNDFS